MGNSSFSVCSINKLGFEIAGHFESTSKTPQPVLSSLILFPQKQDSSPISELFNILILNSKKVELFCLLTGESRGVSYIAAAGSNFTSCAHLPRSQYGNVLIVSDSTGILHILEVYSLTSLVDIAFNNSVSIMHQQKEQITTVSKVNQEFILTGHLNGSIKLWDLTKLLITSTWPNEKAPKCIVYSKLHKLFVVSFDSFAVAPLKVFQITNREDPGREVPDFEGMCLSIVVLDRENFLLALNNQNHVFVWDILTGALLLRFGVENSLVKGATGMTSIELETNQSLLVIGGSDGCVLISELAFNPDASDLSWQPFKRIVAFNQGKVASLEYSWKIDSLIVGSSESAVNIIPNVLWDMFGEGAPGFEAKLCDKTDFRDSDNEVIEFNFDKPEDLQPESTESELRDVEEDYKS